MLAEMTRVLEAAVVLSNWASLQNSITGSAQFYKVMCLGLQHSMLHACVFMSIQCGPEQSGAFSQSLLGSTGEGYGDSLEDHDKKN